MTDNYFIRKKLDENKFLHPLSGGTYQFKEGLPGAAMFTLKYASELINLVTEGIAVPCESLINKKK